MSKPLDQSLALAGRRMGKKGGLRGGRARAAKLTAEERTAIARKAAEARWTAVREAQDREDEQR